MSVFSTPVEVFLRIMFSGLFSMSLLHARGGVSRCRCGSWTSPWSSPRPWRCFLRPECSSPRQRVFSTPVEVFLLQLEHHHICNRLLHARGGVSAIRYMSAAANASSPRPWRCFFRSGSIGHPVTVFSTPVEVFLFRKCAYQRRSGLLHARGGVSVGHQSRNARLRSSPRPWRCFFNTG